MKAVVAYDTTPYVRLSIEEVVKTLFEAIVLVFLVMYLFLQNFRATLIPTIAVPVVLLGTFAVLNACGFSINTLTMFAMVLAIGLLVDDAIVVVENVERVMSEEGLATQGSHTEIDGADYGCAGRDCIGAISRVCSHGLLRRLSRGDLPPVLHYHRLGHGVVGYCRPDPDPPRCAPHCSSLLQKANMSYIAASSAGSTACLTVRVKVIKTRSVALSIGVHPILSSTS